MTPLEKYANEKNFSVILEQTLAEIHAILDGRAFCHFGIGRVLQGWGAWSHYAGTGEWA